MTKVIEAADGIYRVEFDHPRALASTEVYLLRGDVAVTIETGPSIMIPEVLEALRLLNWGKGEVSYIIPTHIHLDHGGGAGRLVEELSKARVVAHRGAARHLIDPTKLIEGTRQVFGDNFEQRYGAILPISSERVLAIEGGEILNLGGRELEICHTPGHAHHHIVILDKKTRGLFCGEALGHYFPEVDLISPAITLPLFEVEMAKESVRNIRRLKPAMLLFSQRGMSKDVDRLIDLAEVTINALSGIALEAFRQGTDAEKLSERLKNCHERLVKERRTKIPWRFSKGLKQSYGQMARAFLAYYAKKNT